MPSASSPSCGFGVTDMERPEPSELADDGLPLSDIDPQTGWQYGEVGA